MQEADPENRKHLQERSSVLMAGIHACQARVRGVEAASRLMLKSFLDKKRLSAAVDPNEAAEKFARRWLAKVGGNRGLRVHGVLNCLTGARVNVTPTTTL